MIPIIIDKALSNKIPMIAFFPNSPSNKKNNLGTESLKKDETCSKKGKADLSFGTLFFKAEIIIRSL